MVKVENKIKAFEILPPKKIYAVNSFGEHPVYYPSLSLTILYLKNNAIYIKCPEAFFSLKKIYCEIAFYINQHKSMS